MPKALTQPQKDEIGRRFEAGEPKASIARAMNLSHDCVVRNTPKVQVQAKLTEDQIAEIVRLVENGETKSAVARRIGVQRKTVGQHTQHIGRKLPEILPEKKAELIRRAMVGESVAAIARDLAIERTTALRIVSRTLRDFELSNTQKEAIQVAREKGGSLAKISSELAIPVSVVRLALSITSGTRYPNELRQAVIRAIESGETAVSAAKRLGVQRTTAHMWFQAAVARSEAQIPQKTPEKRDDLQFAWITRHDTGLEEWRELIVGWFRAEKPSPGSAINAVTAFIDGYLIAANLPRKPADLLQRGALLPDFFDTACPKSVHGRRYNTLIFELIEWVLDSTSFADTDSDKPIRITELYRNPINPNAGRGNATPPITESTKVVLPYFLIADLRKRVVQGPNFKDWTWVQGLMGYETISGQALASDWFPVNEKRIDRNDPDCVWRHRQRLKHPPVLEMWSPVRWVHTLFHLQTTTRGGQARMVDSGEADTFIWKDGNFIANSGSLKLGTARKPRQQGIFRRTSPEETAQGATISLYFNTNKTADQGKPGTAKGFECAWPQMANLEENPYYWLAKLRDWQMKYNPIDNLTPWRALKGSAKLSPRTEEQASEYPDTAFLFRAAENSAQPAWPIVSGDCYKAWQKLLTAYQDVLTKEGITHPSGQPIQLINQTNGRAWSSPHATRVSLITHLIMDGNVPPAIMMKIAGHARFIMTIYYTKVGLTGIQNALKAGAEKIEQTKFHTFERDLLSAKLEQMRDKVVFNAEDWQAVLPVNPADRNPMGWLHMHDGICLAGGNTRGDSYTPGCHNGGPISKWLGLERKPLHGPVPGGVRNCSRCRWKAAGKQHILGLAATFDNRAYHMHKAKGEAIAAERDRNRLMQEKASVEAANAPYSRMTDLINAERRYEAAMQRFQELALDVAALHRIIERVMALPDNIDGPTALMAQGDLMTVNMVIKDTDSELLQLAAVCADVEFFPDLDPGTAIYEFAHLLDYAFEREGQPMVLARLSEKEKLAAANAIMRELERRANPDNSILGRRQVVEIMDRGESLEKMLGVKLKSILHVADHSSGKPVSLRLVNKETDNDNEQRCAS